MTLAALAARIQRMEDIEEIKQLKAKFMLYADLGDQERWAACFAHDAVFDGGIFGKWEGRDKLKALKHLPFAVHFVTNPIITVNGDTATGSWYILEPCTFPEHGALWGAARYEDEYVREDGAWKFKHIKLFIFFYTPFDQGWEKARNVVAAK